MAGYRIVKQGDYLAAITEEEGFSSFGTIWDHPNNAALKANRNPNILFPGDEIYIPNLDSLEESRSTGKRHSFVLNRSVVHLRLVLEDVYEKPIANANCALVLGNGETRTIKTSATGGIDEIVPPDTHAATVLIQDSQTAAAYEQINIKVGHLDPVDQLSGQQARLSNLGYFWGRIGSSPGVDFESAVEEFQCDHPPLLVDGKCGSQTQAALNKIHGC